MPCYAAMVESAFDGSTARATVYFQANERSFLVFLCIEALHKVLLCLMLQLMKLPMMITAQVMVDCIGMFTLFSLLSGNWSVFMHVLCAVAVDLQGASLLVVSIFSNASCFEGSIAAFKLVSICLQRSALRNC